MAAVGGCVMAWASIAASGAELLIFINIADNSRRVLERPSQWTDHNPIKPASLWCFMLFYTCKGK